MSSVAALAYGALATAYLVAHLDWVPNWSETDGWYRMASDLGCGEVLSYALWGPIVPHATAALSPLVGSAYLANKLISLASASVLVGLVAFGTLRHLCSWYAALLATTLVALAPNLLYFGTMAISDVLPVMLICAAVLAALESVGPTRRPQAALVAGLLAAMAAQCRYQYYAVVVFLALALVVAPGRTWRHRVTDGMYALGPAVIGWMVLLLVVGSGRAGPDGAVLLGVSTGYDSVGDWFGPWLAGVPLRYLRSARMLSWVVGFLPLLGLARRLRWFEWRWMSACERPLFTCSEKWNVGSPAFRSRTVSISSGVFFGNPPSTRGSDSRIIISSASQASW